MVDTDSFADAMPRFTSVRAVGSFEIGQVDMNAAYLNGILTSIYDAVPMNERPGYLIPAEFAVKIRIPSPVPKDSG